MNVICNAACVALLVARHNAIPATRQTGRLRVCLATVAALASLVLAGLSVAQVISMPSREAPIDAPGTEKYQARVAAYSRVPSFGEFLVPAPLAAEVARAKLVGGADKIAFGRVPNGGAIHVDIPAGTTQARVTVTSAGAQMIRAALLFSDASDYDIAAWSPDSEIAVLMTSANRAFGQLVWTPVTSGEQQVLVVTRRSNDGQVWSIDAPRVSHFYAIAAPD